MRGSISKVVQDLLVVRPCIIEAIKFGIVNYSALARLLLSDVKRRIGEDVKISSIKMAILRLAESRRVENKSIEKSFVRIIGNSSLTFIDDITVVTIWEKELLNIIPKIFERSEKARFFQVTEGVGHITLILDRNTFKLIKDELPRNLIEEIIEDQTAIIMISPKDILRVPGVVSYITSILSSKGINITQFISCHTDSIFVISREDAINAYTLLKKLIEKFRESLPS